MATRCLLHRLKLDDFKKWAIEYGWSAYKTKGEYEALRMKKENKWLIIYDRDRGDHFSVRDEDSSIIKKFIHQRPDLNFIDAAYSKEIEVGE